MQEPISAIKAKDCLFPIREKCKFPNSIFRSTFLLVFLFLGYPFKSIQKMQQHSLENIFKNTTHMFNKLNIIDLTHTLDEHVPTWKGSCGFEQEIKMDYSDGLRVLKYHCHAGIGTHIDAPSHFYKNGCHVADIPLEKLIVPACIIDVRAKCCADLMISPKDIETNEEKFGPISQNHLVIAHTGWSKHWNNPSQYRNPDLEGNMHFPGFSKEAAELLLKRKVAGIGIDTLSPDGSNNRIFPVHHLILGAGGYIIENLTNLEKMPPRGAFVLALPLKIRTGTESPLRVIALLEK